MVELLKYPEEKDWEFVKTCTLNTVGKKSITIPTEEWKIKLLESEHSPIRELNFAFKLTIPYYVSTHFVRHSAFNRHYVQSQRNDRQNEYDRTKAPQDSIVSHIVCLNAQSFIDMCHVRLCKQASQETQDVVAEMVRLTLEKCPEFKSVLVPKCVYRNGKCTEFYPCGKYYKKVPLMAQKYKHNRKIKN